MKNGVASRVNMVSWQKIHKNLHKPTLWAPTCDPDVTVVAQQMYFNDVAIKGYKVLPL